VPAVLAGIDVTAKGRRAAVLNRRHDLELSQGQVAGLGDTIAGSFSSEDIGDLECPVRPGSACACCRYRRS
jgi:hypothetical protein